MPAGWPSSNGQATLKTSLRYNTKLTAPLSTVNSWNAKAIFLPFRKSFKGTNTGLWDTVFGALDPHNASAVLFGAWTVYVWKDADPEPDFLLGSPAFVIPLYSDLGSGPTRLCGAGIEAINSSSDLYRGGTYYAWRAPAQLNDLFVNNVNLPVKNLARGGKVLQGLPTSLAQVINFPNTVMGSARNGVGTFSVPEDVLNSYVSPIPSLMMLAGDVGATVPFFTESTDNCFYPWHMCGFYLTGLAPQATFELTARHYFEAMVASDTPISMQSFATPSVPRSFLVEEMLAQVLSTCPAGYDYSDNPLGEWLSSIVDVLASVAPTVIGMLPVPGASAIGAAAKPLLNSVSASLKTHAANKKAKAKQQPAKAKGRG